ncbi:MAG: DUF2062 domain-containing protein [Pseudomonadota bacterium]
MFRRRKPLGWTQQLKELIWPKAGWRRVVMYLKHRVFRLRASPYSIAAGFACGVAMSFTPLVGFHFIIAAVLTWPIRGNVIAAALGTLIGNPITFPIMWGASYQLGLVMLGRPSLVAADGSTGLAAALQDMANNSFLTNVIEITGPWMLGSMVIGPCAAIIAFILVRFGVIAYRKRLPADRLRRYQKPKAANRSSGPAQATKPAE